MPLEPQGGLSLRLVPSGVCALRDSGKQRGSFESARQEHPSPPTAKGRTSLPVRTGRRESLSQRRKTDYWPSMAFRVEIAPQAFADLDAIADYIKQRGGKSNENSEAHGARPRTPTTGVSGLGFGRVPGVAPRASIKVAVRDRCTAGLGMEP